MISFFWALDVTLSQVLEVTWLNRVWQSLPIKTNYSFWGKLNFEFLVEFRKHFLLLTHKQLELLIRTAASCYLCSTKYTLLTGT